MRENYVLKKNPLLHLVKSTARGYWVDVIVKTSWKGNVVKVARLKVIIQDRRQGLLPMQNRFIYFFEITFFFFLFDTLLLTKLLLGGSKLVYNSRLVALYKKMTYRNHFIMRYLYRVRSNYSQWKRNSRRPSTGKDWIHPFKMFWWGCASIR